MSLFTRIINRDLPAEIVYENEEVIVFMDIYPKSPGHTLVVPKLEVANFDELPVSVLHPLIEVVSQVAKGQMRAFGNKDYNLGLNNGTLAGQEVFHVHVHVIPRYEKGKEPRGELKNLAEQLRKAFC